MNKYKRARQRAGYTQKELSNIIGVEASVLSRYELDAEHNKITPPEERKKAIADACGITLEFLEDEQPDRMSLLTIEQKARFAEVVRLLDQKINKPQEICGNTHPFRYLLKARWVPIVQDALYLDLFSKIIPYVPSQYILLGSNSTLDNNLSPEDRLAVNKLLDEKHREEDRMLLAESLQNGCDTKIIEEDGIKRHYINIDGIDPYVQKALLLLVKTSKKANQKGLTITPVKGHEDTFDVWEKVSDDAYGSSAWAIGMDMTADEAEKLIDNYIPEKEEPPQDPEDPEAE